MKGPMDTDIYEARLALLKRYGTPGADMLLQHYTRLKLMAILAQERNSNMSEQFSPDQLALELSHSDSAQDATQLAQEYTQRICEQSQALNDQIYQQATFEQRADPTSTEPAIPAAEE